MAKRPPLKVGRYLIGKECGGRWFPGFGRGYWDGWHYYLTRGYKRTMRLKFRTFEGGFAIGPLMVWEARLDERG